ncbi:uncharacterized protein IUM83_00510 [Phytophthora cinnamomi]|uniref:uncharacterized protein n=1 Tax=Phytophthora cinnamomi TaxID=4785 RepID=UPI003559DE9E|nr:hypothetical protein IUM83_00510 [Phytophthora cinnamomi]
MADPSWQEALASETDAAKKEWMALERRYHIKLTSEDAGTQDRCVQLFLSLSDPELPARLKGQVELQMMLPGKYPTEAAQMDFAQWSGRLSGEQVEALNAAVNERAGQLRGGFSLRKLLTWVDNNFWRIIEPFEKALEKEQEPLMSRWDKQKYRGQNKTESKKFKRVGAEAKRRRENANGNANPQ